MDNIRIVKLQNGEDLVGTLTTNEYGNYKLEEPMSFEIDFRNNSSGLIMRHWLPVQLIKKNEIELKKTLQDIIIYKKLSKYRKYNNYLKKIFFDDNKLAANKFNNIISKI